MRLLSAKALSFSSTGVTVEFVNATVTVTIRTRRGVNNIKQAAPRRGGFARELLGLKNTATDYNNRCDCDFSDYFLIMQITSPVAVIHAPPLTINFSTFMGEWERKAEAKAHEQRTDLVVDKTAATSGPQGQVVLVTCFKTVQDAAMPYGSLLRLLDRKRARVEVFLAGRCVGEVCNEDTRTLREHFGIATRKGSSFGGQCVSETDTPQFSVEVTI